MKIRSAVPENGYLIFLTDEKNKTKQKKSCKTYTHPPHRRLRKKTGEEITVETDEFCFVVDVRTMRQV